MKTTARAVAAERHGPQRHRRLVVWLLPTVFTGAWLLYVLVFGHVTRVSDHWRSSMTMVFGSFVAGSTPQGGGAIAFPVFTKVLEIPPAVARSFGLTIQATGMVMASATILLSGRAVDYKALRLGVVGGSIGFLGGALLLSDFSTPFADAVIPAAYVKVSFTIAVTMVATIVWLCAGRSFEARPLQQWSQRGTIGLITFAAVGGVASSLTGSGVDVFLFLFIVLAVGIHPTIAVPTSVIAMAWTSILGLVVFGIFDGQLNVSIQNGSVVAVDGHAIGPLDPRRADLFGIWLAAAPIVVWGAPLGSWVASRLSSKTLVNFVAVMAVAELVTTVVFLDQLRDDLALALFALGGLAAALAGTVWLAHRGRSFFGFEGSARRSSSAV